VSGGRFRDGLLDGITIAFREVDALVGGVGFRDWLLISM